MEITRNRLYPVVFGIIGLFILASGLMPTTLAQNATQGLEQQMQSAIQAAPSEAVASGNIFVVVCPAGSTDPNQCQVFTTQPAR
jgi:Tfp pilus assembly protein FimT